MSVCVGELSAVSIHAPWEGCNSEFSLYGCFAPRFQFTHPGKGATRFNPFRLLAYQVSIHAPWEGCNYPKVTTIACRGCFNSRTLGRVQQSMAVALALNKVSIHAPWEGCNVLGYGFEITINPFQFTHPGKGATHYSCSQEQGEEIVSIHAPWEGCNASLPPWYSPLLTFQFTHPGKGATNIRATNL